MEKKNKSSEPEGRGLIEAESLYLILGILTIGVVTPGPNNMTCIVHSSIHGPKANIRLISGMALGFLIVHIVAGFVVLHVDADHPGKIALEVVGILFLMLIALKVFTLQPSSIQQQITAEHHSYSALFKTTSIPQLGFKTGMMMQFINGKEWTLVGAVLLQVLDNGSGIVDILLVTALTVPGGILAMTMWTILGGRLSSFAMDEKRGKMMFKTIGGLMFVLLAIVLLNTL
ncbi:MAG: LysE family transporter [Candidatus Poseidoniales archaeon]